MKVNPVRVGITDVIDSELAYARDVVASEVALEPLFKSYERV